MRIQILLDQPELSGGTLNVIRVANLLLERGRTFGISAQGDRPDWLEWRGDWHDHQGFTEPPPKADLYLCTYWTSVRWAAELHLEPRIHFCQGYEGDLVHLAEVLPAIEEVYRLSDPMWVVSDMLSERLAEFHRKTQVIPPVPAQGIHPRFRRAPHKIARVLVPGIFESEVKNIPTALKAIHLLRERGWRIELHRLSTWPCSAEERSLCRAEVYHHHLLPQDVNRLLPTLDLLLFPSRKMEGFGLPVLEAALAGVPSVISRIPSLVCFQEAGFPTVDPENAVEFADAAEILLNDAQEWRRMRKLGLQAAKQFSRERTRNALQMALGPTISGSTGT